MGIVLTIVIGLSGLFIGFLAQRSRMCFVAGFRDFLLVGDRELLNGLFSFLVTVWVLTSLFGMLDLLPAGLPEYGRSGTGRIETAVTTDEETTMAEDSGGVFHPGGTAFLQTRFFWVTLAGGFLMGLLSVSAGGCVLRQHVLLAQGSMDALFYLAGFYMCVAVYYIFLQPFFVWIYG